jgi:hypothetical protein
MKSAEMGLPARVKARLATDAIELTSSGDAPVVTEEIVAASTFSTAPTSGMEPLTAEDPKASVMPDSDPVLPSAVVIPAIVARTAVA